MSTITVGGRNVQDRLARVRAILAQRASSPVRAWGDHFNNGVGLDATRWGDHFNNGVGFGGDRWGDHFNIEEAEGAHAHSSLRASDAARCRAFFRRLAELRKASGLAVTIRELDSMARRVFATGEPHSGLNRPLATLNFDCEGNISTFSPELLTVNHPKYRHFRFGNVFECGVDDILDSERFRTAYEDVRRGVERCRVSCPYFSVCGGGEPGNKLAENGTLDSTETMHCRTHVQALCDVVLEGMEERLGIPGPPAPAVPVEGPVAAARQFIPLAMV